MASDSTTSTCNHHQFLTRSYGDDQHRRDTTFEVTNGQSLTHQSLNSPISTYASSTENISRLLEGWMRSSPKATKEKVLAQNSSAEEGNMDMAGSSTVAAATVSSVQCYRPKLEQVGSELISNDEFESILSLENLNDDDHHHTHDAIIPSDDHHEMKMNHDQKKHNPPLSFLEKWLMDETAAQGEEMMDQLSPIF